ncbi:hypothetical protein Rin_00018910 [Candidatus Regiella insecticola 5.15]|uniref:Uncharacterized protein n=1 Tax=Candidatus Regiella insecticola 5.15 TaxID=1005043 RepID=G2H1E8_9ENTR|nr:hypothetical protein [Candidatus Regiella insecticola]EGY28183.1 hypothetical protein Rin_00018910 [Candidatus Regiella insecticola 5.15]
MDISAEEYDLINIPFVFQATALLAGVFAESRSYLRSSVGRPGS